MDKKININTFNEDKLVGAAVALDSALYLMQNITEDFFCKFNPDSEKDKFAILWEFSRYRAFVQAVNGLLADIHKDFEENGITPYWD